MMQAIAIPTERARTLGVGFGLVRETRAPARFDATRMAGGARLRRPHDGLRPGVLRLSSRARRQHGHKPVAIAVPSDSGPIVLDMATSTISNGTIIQSRANGTHCRREPC